MRPIRAALAAGAALGVVAGLSAAAFGLWHADDELTIPPFAIGGVSFSAQPTGSGGDGLRDWSSDGGAVTVTLPASTIVQVLDDPDPVTWTFQATGFAQGYAGLIYDVAAGDQVDAGGNVTHSLASGVADPDTFLGHSTLKIYPASASGDCSSVPATPAGGAGKNVLVYSGDDHLLHAPGADDAGTPITQTWCATVQAGSSWGGAYANKVTVRGKADDGTWSSAQDRWSALLTPDPDEEPSVTITLAPTVTRP
jgi:hypothetical protein